MHSNHQSERERDIQALKKHFGNQSFFTRLRDSRRLAWATQRTITRFVVISWLGILTMLALYPTNLDRSTIWLIGVGVSIVATVLVIKLRPNK
jgi:hypothetical protein